MLLPVENEGLSCLCIAFLKKNCFYNILYLLNLGKGFALKILHYFFCKILRSGIVKTCCCLTACIDCIDDLLPVEWCMGAISLFHLQRLFHYLFTSYQKWRRGLMSEMQSISEHDQKSPIFDKPRTHQKSFGFLSVFRTFFGKF